MKISIMNVNEYEEALAEEETKPEKPSKVRYQPWLCHLCNHDVGFHFVEYEHEPITFAGNSTSYYMPIDNGVVKCTHYNCNCFQAYEDYMKGTEEARRMR
jgi:hypothetical protein